MRRIKTPHAHRRRLFRAPAATPKIVAILKDLWGTVRFDTGKLNMKSAGYGAPVEWHQDWAFYPHTNDDLAAVGIMIDDATLENGPMMVVPGSHRGPILRPSRPGRPVLRRDRPGATATLDVSKAVPCLGKAGSMTVHHVRAVHGSATNFSGAERRFLLYQYRAADAWPLLGFKDGIEKFDELLLVGEPSLAPRLVAVPVRLPLPPAEHQGSIYENQRATGRRFFETAAQGSGGVAIPVTAAHRSAMSTAFSRKRARGFVVSGSPAMRGRGMQSRGNRNGSANKQRPGRPRSGSFSRLRASG